MNHRALKRGDLDAFFEPYSNLVRGVVASLSLKMYDLFFLKSGTVADHLDNNN